MPARIDVMHKKFNRALVIADAPKSANGRRRVTCLCDCGTVFVCDPRLLMCGKTNSCGCYHKDVVSNVAIMQGTHFMARTPEYNSWSKMKSRCYNKNNKKYHCYGGRGIAVCDEWINSFENFLRDMGIKPFEDSSIERIDVNGNYEPSNCRWAGMAEQSRNKRNTIRVLFNNKLIALIDACEILGINYKSAVYRYKNGQNWMPLPKAPE